MMRGSSTALNAIRGLLLTAAAVGLMGCQSAGKQRYLNHLATVVEPGPAASDAVALAFGLDDYGTSTEMLVSADPDQ